MNAFPVLYAYPRGSGAVVVWPAGWPVGGAVVVIGYVVVCGALLCECRAHNLLGLNNKKAQCCIGATAVY